MPPAASAPPDTALFDAVRELRAAVAQVRLPLDLPSAQAARADRQGMLQQFDDYVLPRLASLDAPLLAVVGGSTGAGKSTLVNSLVGAVVARSGVTRPTTRSPMLVHNPADTRWFDSDRVLPGLPRVTGGDPAKDGPGTLRLTQTPAIPPGIALLDAPDIDSVVDANRALSRQLLQAADLWLFVTTAARYADAVPWELLRQAATRGTAVAIVLDRVPPEAAREIFEHLSWMLGQQGLGGAPVFVVNEARLTQSGLLDEREVIALRDWLARLAADLGTRSAVIRRTLSGTLDSLGPRGESIAAACDEQVALLRRLHDSSYVAFGAAVDGVRAGMADGTLLRGEVLARWQDLVGTGEFFRQIEKGVGRLRDRVSDALAGRGNREAERDLGKALESSVATLILAQAQGAASTTVRSWRTMTGGPDVLSRHPGLARVSEGTERRVEQLVRDWQGELLDLVRSEAGGRRNTARALAFGVNGVAVLLMLVVFASTAGLTGAEVGIAGGSSVLAQRLLEAVFGDQAVRSLATKARDMLMNRVGTLMQDEQHRYDAALDDSGTAPESAAAVRAALARVQQVRAADASPEGRA